MSYESEQTLSHGARIADVREFVELLGYKRLGILRFEDMSFEEYVFFDETDYRSWSGVELSIHRKNGRLVVGTRSTVSRSYYDLAHQNRTIASIRKRFGGNFTTDEGRNRYLRTSFGPPSPAASGCHLAFDRFGVNLIKAHHYHSTRQLPSAIPDLGRRYLWLLEHDPRVLANNALIPYLLATIEEYFKSTFIAILRYSPRKETFFKTVRLQGEQLAAISGGATVEEQVVENLPFQRISAITRHFAALDPKLDLAATLRKPYHRRKQSLFDRLERLVETRHSIIHRAILDVSFTDDAVTDVIYDLDAALTRVYKRITAYHSWPFDRGWYLRRRTSSRNKRLRASINSVSRLPTIRSSISCEKLKLAGLLV